MDDPPTAEGALPVPALLGGSLADDPRRVLQHVLLATDGTVVPLLEGCFGEPIRLADHVQACRPALPTDPAELELSEGETVLRRKVVLRGARTGCDYVSADSLLASDRLPDKVRQALLTTSRPIGRVLADHRVETLREILRVGRTRWETPGKAGGTERLFRTYRVVSGNRPVMLITEYYPPLCLPEVAGQQSPTLTDPIGNPDRDRPSQTAGR